MREVRFLGPLLALALAAASLRAQGPSLPPINTPPTNQSLQGKIVWADLHTSDPEAAIRFYTALFGWTANTLRRHGRAYTILSSGGQPVAGVAERPAAARDQGRGRWIVYLSVADVPRTVAVALANGGRVVFPPKELPARGTQAMLADDQGGLFGILHSSSGDPEDYEPEVGDWAWAHVFAKDSADGMRFYQAVFGYSVTPDTARNRPDVYLLSSQGLARGALGPLPNRPDAMPGWLAFVRVASVDRTVGRVASLGGRVLVDPKSTQPGSRIAILADPVDGAVGVMEMSDPAAVQNQGAQP
ncbi:MAG TPA: VOC family protein [Opitutaceae bacterium]|nr:VOC family protein [Opitutaceae bacterium]